MDVEALIGWNVNRLRTERELSQEELALRCEIIGQGYISKLESGKRNPTAVIQFILAGALGVEVGALYSRSDAPSRITDGPIKIRSTRSKIRTLEIRT
jgi:transcriptional regulator with XRE-family HTH domain